MQTQTRRRPCAVDVLIRYILIGRDIINGKSPEFAILRGTGGVRRKGGEGSGPSAAGAYYKKAVFYEYHLLTYATNKYAMERLSVVPP